MADDPDAARSLPLGIDVADPEPSPRARGVAAGCPTRCATRPATPTAWPAGPAPRVGGQPSGAAAAARPRRGARGPRRPHPGPCPHRAELARPARRPGTPGAARTRPRTRRRRRRRAPRAARGRPGARGRPARRAGRAGPAAAARRGARDAPVGAARLPVAVVPRWRPASRKVAGMRRRGHSGAAPDAPAGSEGAAAPRPPLLRAARGRGDPFFATAPPARRWLLVEHPGPWGPQPLGGAGYDPEIVSAIDALCRAPGARFQLIRRTPARGVAGAHGRFALVETTRGRSRSAGAGSTTPRTSPPPWPTSRGAPRSPTTPST